MPTTAQRGATRLRRLIDQEGLHGLVAGRATRLLLDEGVIDSGDATRRMRLVLSPGAEPAVGAGWVEGFLRDSGTILLHDQDLFDTIDRWVTDMPQDAFDNVLPLLRRTIATFSVPERRSIGERILAGRRDRQRSARRPASTKRAPTWSCRSSPDPRRRRRRGVSDERLRRWRLVLGGGDADGTGLALAGDDLKRDQALERLYDAERSAGLGRIVADGRPLARRHPDVLPVVGRVGHAAGRARAAQPAPDAPRTGAAGEHPAGPEPRDGADRARRRHAGGDAMRPPGTSCARSWRTSSAACRARSNRRSPGALNRAAVTRRPRQRDIDWDRTIRRNLRHYQPDYKTVIPETLLGHARRSNALRDVVIAVDQSGSMAASVVYSSVFAAVMASIRSVETKLVVFDTSVVDLTDLLDDPVEVLFSTQLGGGTDINRAVGYCQTLVTRPADTIFVLISDLFEGGVEQELIARVSQLRRRRRDRDRAPGALGQGRARRSTTTSPRSSRRWERRHSPARRTTSRASWPPPSRSATSAAGRQSRGSPWSARRNPERPRLIPNRYLWRQATGKSSPATSTRSISKIRPSGTLVYKAGVAHSISFPSAKIVLRPSMTAMSMGWPSASAV